MTIEIAQDWFINNISGQEGYTLDSENGVFTKIISEDNLNFEFSADTDGEFLKEWLHVYIYIHFDLSDIILSHTVPVSSSGFAISEAASIRSVQAKTIWTHYIWLFSVLLKSLLSFSAVTLELSMLNKRWL